MRLAQRKLGWIGVDVGKSSVKVAQVAKTKQGWRLAASAIVPRQQLQQELPEEQPATSTKGELQAARSLQQGYRGRNVAAALPMSLCDLHRLDRDLNREADPEKIMRQAIEVALQRSSANLLCDFWSAPATDSQPAWSQVLTVPRDWTEQLCEDIAQVGWNCETLDGAPLAIARAIRMVHPADQEGPIAGLDWGSSAATLCMVENGQPSYVRTLKLDGLDQVIAELVEYLQVSEIEAQRLLEEYGITGKKSEDDNDIATLVTELVTDYLKTLCDELSRSFSHFQYVRRMARPKQLYLLGGGAMIKGLSRELHTELDLRVRNWHLPSEDEQFKADESHEEALLASAIALSALAWERS